MLSGERVRANVQLASGAMLLPHLLVWLKFVALAPSKSTLKSPIAVAAEFVSVSLCSTLSPLFSWGQQSAKKAAVFCFQFQPE